MGSHLGRGRARRVPSRAAVTFCLSLLLAACGGGSPQTATATHGPAASVPTLPGGCREKRPCAFNAGTYVTAERSVLGGLRLTLPGSWSSTENDRGELNLIPPGQPSDRLLLWLDMVAVKSSGLGHGITQLNNVGTTAGALISWLTSNPDFLVVTQPTHITIGHGIKMTSLVVGVSPSAQYGDADCPANPRCADFFTRPELWGGGSYGIGGDEEVHLYIGAINSGGHTDTFFVALDGVDGVDLGQLSVTAQPILDSLQLPQGYVSD